MLTFKENRIEVVRDLLDPVMLEAVQRVIRQALADYAMFPPAFFKPDSQVALRNYLGRLTITEAIMYAIRPRIEEIVGAQLLPTYSFPVIYFPGAELEKHTDRPACEVTGTLTILNEPDVVWPIFVEEGGAAHRLDLNPGDLALYDGIAYPHWREPQPADHFNVSVFYHYVVVGGPLEKWHASELRAKPHMLDLYEPKPLRKLFPKA